MVAHAIPDYVLVGKRERLLAMVDILESVPPEEIRAIARISAFTRLEALDAVLVAPGGTKRGCSCCWRGGRGCARKAPRGGS